MHNSSWRYWKRAAVMWKQQQRHCWFLEIIITSACEPTPLLSSITCFHSSTTVRLLRDSEDAAAALSFFGGLMSLSRMDRLLPLISTSSTALTLSRSEKSCSERFWKLSRLMGLRNAREFWRRNDLWRHEVSKSMSESMDIPAELWCLFFGGLSAETYCWGTEKSRDVRELPKKSWVNASALDSSHCVCPLWRGRRGPWCPRSRRGAPAPSGRSPSLTATSWISSAAASGSVCRATEDKKPKYCFTLLFFRQWAALYFIGCLGWYFFLFAFVWLMGH